MFYKINLNAKFFIVLIIFSRFAFLTYLLLFNLKNEFGEQISPLISQTMGDISFYSKFVNSAWEPLISLIEIRSYANLNDWFEKGFYPGPLFPWMLNISNYCGESPLALSIFFNSLGIANSVIWFYYLRKLNASSLEHILVIFYPNLLYFTGVISTDMLFCIFFSIFFFILTKDTNAILTNFTVAVFFIIVCIFTRPNSLILLPAIGYYLFDKRSYLTKAGLSVAYLSLLLIAIISSIYYLPYFSAYKSASLLISYWGITQKEFIAGIFEFLPYAFNLFLSWLILGFSKMIYLTGLRPSYSGVSNTIVFLRALGGIIILPGIFYMLFRGYKIDKLIFILFITPLFFGASQERYLLPICPILIFYGSRFYKEFFLKLLRPK